MIIEASVLVIEDDKKRRLPQQLVGPDRVIDIGDKLLRSHNIVWRMIVVFRKRGIRRLNQAKFWKLFLVTSRVVIEFVDIEVPGNIMGLPLVCQNGRLRDVVEIDLSMYRLLIEAIE
jgi:hypothetical protein